VSNKRIMLIAIVLGLSTAVTINLYLNKLKAALNNVKTTRVVVAAQDIAAKTEITGAMVEEKEIPADLAHQKGYRQSSEVIGKITSSQIIKGEQVLANRLVDPADTGKGLGYAITKGKRAVSVAVDDVSGLSGLLKPGDKVDILVTMDVDNAGKRVTFTRMFLEDIPVLAVGSIMSEEPETEKNAKNQASAETKTVTLEVYAKDTQPLTVANERGKIRLVLRSPVDNGRANPAPYLPEQLMVRQ